MILIVVLILAVIVTLGLLYVARHGATIWMNA
jgi:NADH:ubiquinone oxidoreductase subunit 3 (subunit A)